MDGLSDSKMIHVSVCSENNEKYITLLMTSKGSACVILPSEFQVLSLSLVKCSIAVLSMLGKYT